MAIPIVSQSVFTQTTNKLTNSDLRTVHDDWLKTVFFRLNFRDNVIINFSTIRHSSQMTWKTIRQTVLLPSAEIENLLSFDVQILVIFFFFGVCIRELAIKQCAI